MYLEENLEKLPNFIKIAEIGSFNKAAKKLGMTQAALSLSIQSLETALDIQLFTRSSKGIYLTPKGKLLYDFSKRLLTDCQNLENNLIGGKQEQSIEFKVGTHQVLAGSIWPTIIKNVNAKGKELSFSLTSGRHEDLIKGLLNQTFHFCILTRPKSKFHFKFEKLYTGSMGFYVSKASKFYRKNYDFNYLKRIPIITDLSAQLAQGKTTLDHLRELGLEELFQYQVNSFQVAKSFCLNGLGIAYLPRIEEFEDSNLELIKIRGLPQKNHGSYEVYLIYDEKNYQESLIDVISKIKEQFELI